MQSCVVGVMCWGCLRKYLCIQDAGYGEKSLFTPIDEDNDEDVQVKMDDEVFKPSLHIHYINLMSSLRCFFAQDAGYGERSLFAPEEDDEDEAQTKIDDEVL